jgi:hypothetical protein
MEATKKTMRPWQVALNDYLNGQSHIHREGAPSKRGA